MSIRIARDVDNFACLNCVKLDESCFSENSFIQLKNKLQLKENILNSKVTF